MEKKKLSNGVEILGLLLPSPVTLVTTIAEDGTPNIFACSYISQVAMEPFTVVIGVRPRRYSYWLMKMTGELVVNIPTLDMVDEVYFCGRTSGQRIDKFAQTGLTPIPARQVKPPLIKECIAHLECKIVEEKRVGSHRLMITEVVAALVNESAYDWNRPRGYQLDEVRPLLFLQDDPFRFTTAEREVEPQPLVHEGQD